uniref:glutathione transferase n=1 Tax=Oreochromis niloticus TaxID=8128 RepID=A0A669EZZ0_ORENI
MSVFVCFFVCFSSLNLILPKMQRSCHGKVVLHSFNGRGSMESIRWLLTVAEVQFDEMLLNTRTDFEKLLSDGALMFQHAPMLEIDGMKLVQIKAISPRSTTCTERTSKIESCMLHFNNHGIIKREFLILYHGYPKPKLDNIQSRAKERYLPVYEKRPGYELII